MKIGPWIISDTWKPSDGGNLLRKSICDTRSNLNPIYWSAIVIAFMRDPDNKSGICFHYEVYLYTPIREMYNMMFGDCAQYSFQSLDEAKSRIEFFLDKLSKLKAFV